MRMRWRNLELPTRVTVDRDTLSDAYGKFIVEPFERGFGHTIGNGLRRVLLSSIEGTAVRWISVKGAEHEFQPVDGVTEDMTDIVLNVKNIKVRMSGDGPVTLRIRKSEKGPVTGADIAVEGDALVVNPEVHICTLNKKVDFEMDLEVARGRGYWTAEENEFGSSRFADPRARRSPKESDQQIGRIWLDSCYSPVLRVKYATEDTRVGKITDYDRLVLEIWTDGSIRPEEALSEASKIYRKCLNALVSYGASGGEIPVTDAAAHSESTSSITPVDPQMAMPVQELALSVRANNCLESERIFTVGDLVARSTDDLLSLRNFGKTTLTEIRAKLAEIGLTLRGDTMPTADELGNEPQSI